MRSIERGWSIIPIWIFFNMPVEKGAENMHFVRKMRKLSCDGRGRSDKLCQRSWGCPSSQNWRGLKARQERAGVVRELETVREVGYLRKKMVMETLPEVSMPFYVLIPDTLKGGEQYAAMLAFPAHGANKDTVARVVTGEEVRRKVENTPEECYGREFVKRGYVVFCPDPPGFGERREALPAEDAAFAAGRQA